MIRNKRYPRGGFTLIELLVVVLIIGILAAIALPQYRKAVAKAELTQLLNVTKAFVTSLHSYYLANDKFPIRTNGVQAKEFLDISTSDENIMCSVVDSGDEINFSFVHCSNKNFAVWTQVEAMRALITEVGMNSVDENPSLSYAAKELFGTRLNSCYKSTDYSSTCDRLGLNASGCFLCRGIAFL